MLGWDQMLFCTKLVIFFFFRFSEKYSEKKIILKRLHQSGATSCVLAAFDVARGDLRQQLRCSCIPRHSFAFATAAFATRSRGTPRAELQPRALQCERLSVATVRRS